jgi:hypothetical protein
MNINKALIKHGFENFSLEILEYCDSSELLKKENDYFKLFKPEYNICKEPGNTLGIKYQLSNETKLRMSAARKGRIHSEESKLQNSLSQSNRIRIEVTDLELNTIISYNSIREAARALSCPAFSISVNINSKNKKPYKGRYIFKILKV